MNIKPLHPNFKCPVYSSDNAGGMDLFMPTRGSANKQDARATEVGLGFAAAVPEGHVALLLPRSGAGAKKGVSLNNTVGVIDADYRGEWKAYIRNRNLAPLKWDAGDRLLQAVIVKAEQVSLDIVDELDDTARGEGGIGSTGEK